MRRPIEQFLEIPIPGNKSFMQIIKEKEQMFAVLFLVFYFQPSFFALP
jgi:hypothetical protein